MTQPLRMTQSATGDQDPAAETLAAKLGGRASQTVTGFGNREFDAVSSEFIAQTTASRSAITKPANFLTRMRKAQIRATLQAAKQECKEAYFEFTAGSRIPKWSRVLRGMPQILRLPFAFIIPKRNDAMNIEIAEYSAYLGLPELSPEALADIQKLARETLGEGNITLGTGFLEFDYSGRDPNRKYVQFLCRIAPIIGNAEGEVECHLITDTDKRYLEFYSIQHFRLYRQVGKILKMQKTEICLESQPAFVGAN